MKSNRLFGIRAKKFIDFKNLIANLKNIKNFSFFQKIFNQKNIAIFNFTNEEYSYVNKKNDYIVLIDGHVTNLEDLKIMFNLEGHTQNDIVLEMLNNGIEDIENYLIGSYAISIFDESSGNFKIFRDFIGSKPLFYLNSNECFAFSSEIKFLKCINEFDIKPNKRRIIQYLCQYKEFKKDTFYENIFLCEPSFVYKFVNGELIKHKYNHYKNYFSKSKNLETGKEELIEALSNSILQTSKIYPDSSAVLLSGGLDSSCIYAIFSEVLKNDSVQTISKNFYDSNGKLLKCDESFYQELVHKNKNNLSAKFKEQSPFSNVDYWLERYDEPFNLANAYLFHEVMKTASKNNINVLFDGIDGDTVVSHGWERFKELFNVFSLPAFFYELWSFSRIHDYTNQTKSSIFRLFFVSLLRNNFLLRPFFWLNDKFKRLKKKSRLKVVKENVLKKYNYHESYDFYRNFRPHSEKINNPLIDTGYINLNILFFEYGIHQVSPFFDRRVVDLCLSFPSSYKLRHGKSRYILRESFKKYLPKEIIKRFQKANLTENFSIKINQSDLREIEKEINSIHPLLKDVIDMQSLIHLFKKFSHKTLDEKTNMSIWAFFLTNKWLKKNF